MVPARLSEATVERRYRQARADRWRLPIAAFRAALEASAGRGCPADAEVSRIERYLDSLHLEDLALACACAEGREEAWDQFVLEYRPALYRAADAIDPTGGARDLADSLYAELYGLTERDGARRSHFRYYHGRSSLGTWLRAVLSQRVVDRVRSVKRLDPLPPDEGPHPLPAPAPATSSAWPRYVALMRRLVAEAVARLAPKERLRLACYYAQELTLAQVGAALGEHEATVSRQLSRTRRAIREQVEQALRDQERMSPGDIADCFAAVVEDAGPLDLADLLGTQTTRKTVVPDRSR